MILRFGGRGGEAFDRGVILPPTSRAFAVDPRLELTTVGQMESLDLPCFSFWRFDARAVWIMRSSGRCWSARDRRASTAATTPVFAVEAR
jgi:hypothetical protein